jgi:hypothetical protein
MSFVKTIHTINPGLIAAFYVETLEFWLYKITLLHVWKVSCCTVLIVRNNCGTG